MLCILYFVLYYTLGFILVRYFVYRYLVDSYTEPYGTDLLNWTYVIGNVEVENTVMFLLLLMYPLGIPILLAYLFFCKYRCPLFKNSFDIIDSKNKKDLDKEELLRPCNKN